MVWEIKKYIYERYMLGIINLLNRSSLKRTSGFILNEDDVDGPVFQLEEMEHVKMTV